MHSLGGTSLCYVTSISLHSVALGDLSEPHGAETSSTPKVLSLAPLRTLLPTTLNIIPVGSTAGMTKGLWPGSFLRTEEKEERPPKNTQGCNKTREVSPGGYTQQRIVRCGRTLAEVPARCTKDAWNVVLESRHLRWGETFRDATA